MHLNGTSSVANSHEVRLYESSSVLLRSLIGFTIALIPRKATDPESPHWYKTLSNSWLQEGDTLLSTMETVAHSLLFPDAAEAERLVDHFTVSVQSSLGIAFSAAGYPNKASILLRNSLGKIELYKPYGPRPAESVEYGLLSAELINCNNLVDRTEELCSWGLSLTKARDEAHLGRRFDSIWVKLATADAHIALAAYPTAEHVLNQVLGLMDLDPFIKIVSRFRLNKIWRRTDQTAASFGKSLRQIVPLIEDALPEVQVEFLAELAATLAHLRGAEWADSDHSAMNDVVRETLDLYKKHDILQDDWRLERIKVASAKISKAIPIAPQREGSDVSVRHAAIKILGERETLSDGMLEAIAAPLEDSNASGSGMLARFIYDTSSHQDRLVQLSTPTRLNLAVPDVVSRVTDLLAQLTHEGPGPNYNKEYISKIS